MYNSNNSNHHSGLPGSGDRNVKAYKRSPEGNPQQTFASAKSSTSKHGSQKEANSSKELNASRSNTALKSSTQQLSKLMEINNSRKVAGLANMPQSTSPKGGHHGQPVST